MKSLRFYLATATCILIPSQFPTWAHSPGPVAPAGKYSWMPGRDKYPLDDKHLTVTQEAAIPGAPKHPFFVVPLANRWATTAKLRVCFQGGSDEIRTRILAIGGQWLKYANLTFVTGNPAGQTCTDKDPSEIRIGFHEPGYWSYVGNDSINSGLIASNYPSMNFQGFDENPIAEPRFTGVILHEFGHALGFHHEHQSPAGGCSNEYDWPKTYQVYLALYGWDQQMTQDNLKTFDTTQSAYDYSPTLDKKSIMSYATPDPAILKRGKLSPCYFTENDAISELDKQGATHTYPFEGVTEHLVAQSDTVKALLPLASGSLKDALSAQSNTLLKVMQDH